MEEWKDIIIERNGIVYDYTGLYLVSNTGKIYSVQYGKCMKIAKNKKNGYMQITLSKNGASHSFTIHRLVATAFISNPNNLEFVNHKDENKENNNVDNLEWCTREYNENYGTKKERIGIKNRGRKCTTEQIKHMSEVQKGENNSHASKVLCVETGDIFPTIKMAKEWLIKTTGKDGDISCCCRGKTKTAGGYHWKYVEE